MVKWITDDELAQIREDIAETMPDTCVIKRVTSSISAEGYESGTAVAIGTITARIDIFNRQSVGQYAMLDAARAYYQLTVPYDSTIDDGDTVTIGGADYEVMQAHLGQSKGAVRRALIVRL
jgi:hypothetical protein